MLFKKVGIASDHAGYEMKQKVIPYLKTLNIDVIDYGAYSDERSDYPDFGHKLAKGVKEKDVEVGISLCGSGNGISITVNKHRGIRSALCWNKEISSLARLHNDANICSLPARFITEEEAKDIVHIFLSTEFEGGRHIDRIKKINDFMD